MHQCPPPFVPRVRENQSITKYFEEERDILTDESSSFASREDPAEEPGLLDGSGLYAPEQLECRKAAHDDQERRDLGIENCPDGELDRIKQHLGPEQYEKWRAERVLHVQRAPMVGGDGYPAVKKKVKKRARDKMLRDEVVGKKVMELRKRNAFFGYTYRRPKGVVLDDLFEGRRKDVFGPGT